MYYEPKRWIRHVLPAKVEVTSAKKFGCLLISGQHWAEKSTFGQQVEPERPAGLGKWQVTQQTTTGINCKFSYDNSDRTTNRLTGVTQPMGQYTRYAWDAVGRKLGEQDANGNCATWTYSTGSLAQNYSATSSIQRGGQLTGHKDLGNAFYTYGYDYAGHLTSQVGTAHTSTVTGAITPGQNLSYTYDVSGQLVQIDDAALQQTTTYVYDAAGHRLRETTVQNGIVYQDNQLGYDSQGRLILVQDASASIYIEYDLVGNRTRIATHVITATGGTTSGTAPVETSFDSERYFKYDEMNRQTVVDAVDAAGTLGTQGHRITYDTMGNRTSDAHRGNKVTTTTGTPSITGYTYPNGWDSGDPVPVYATNLTYTAIQGEVVETYTYDKLNRLNTIERDGVQLDLRLYDGAGRVIQTGPGANLPVDYIRALNGSTTTASGTVDAQGTPLPGNGTEKRTNSFDANGRLIYQKVRKSDGTAKYDINYDVQNGTGASASYDSVGNLLTYQLINKDGSAYTNSYTYGYALRETYLQETVDGSSNVFQAGRTTNSYDANGFLIQVSDQTMTANARSYINDAAGHALLVRQGYAPVHAQRQLVANGQVLGRYGELIDPEQARYANGEPKFITVADFNFGYQTINPNYPSATAGSYVVNRGDTLQAIAQGAYGDSSLWYLIADANGLGANQTLLAGQMLVIPNRVGTTQNNANTFKPYDQSLVIGDITPNMPNPPAKSSGGCGGLGQLLVVIVAIVVTVVTAIYIGPAGGGNAGATVLETFAAAMANPVTAVVATAAGNAASQVTAMALGLQDSFSWKQLGLSALSAGIGAGLGASGGLLSGNTLGMTVARAAVANALTQYLPEYFPEPERFDIDRHARADRPKVPNTYAPFTLGSHTCLGAGMAESQLMVVIATLLRHFEFALPSPDYRVEIQAAPIPNPGKGLTVKVVRRR